MALIPMDMKQYYNEKYGTGFIDRLLKTPCAIQKMADHEAGKVIDDCFERINPDIEGSQQVFVWADYSWCLDYELESMLMSGASDDYYILIVPLSCEDIDQFVRDSKCQDFGRG